MNGNNKMKRCSYFRQNIRVATENVKPRCFIILNCDSLFVGTFRFHVFPFSWRVSASSLIISYAKGQLHYSLPIHLYNVRNTEIVIIRDKISFCGFNCFDVWILYLSFLSSYKLTNQNVWWNMFAVGTHSPREWLTFA